MSPRSEEASRVPGAVWLWRNIGHSRYAVAPHSAISALRVLNHWETKKRAWATHRPRRKRHSHGKAQARPAHVLLLTDRTIFDSTGKDRLTSEELAEHLHKMEDRPWPEYGRRNQPISKNQVARLLKPFAISPGTIRCGETTGKGYKLSKFDDVFARYLPFQTVTTSQVNATAGLSPIAKRHKDDDVTVGNPPKATATAGCDVVTVENGGTGDMAISEAEYERDERLAIQTEPLLSPETREANRFLGPEPIPPMFDRRLGVSATKRKD